MKGTIFPLPFHPTVRRCKCRIYYLIGLPNICDWIAKACTRDTYAIVNKTLCALGEQFACRLGNNKKTHLAFPKLEQMNFRVSFTHVYKHEGLLNPYKSDFLFFSTCQHWKTMLWTASNCVKMVMLKYLGNCSPLSIKMICLGVSSKTNIK